MIDHKKYNMMYKFPEIAVEEKHIVATYQVIIKTRSCPSMRSRRSTPVMCRTRPATFCRSAIR